MFFEVTEMRKLSKPMNIILEHTTRQTDREAGRQADRQKHRQTDRQLHNLLFHITCYMLHVEIFYAFDRTCEEVQSLPYVRFL